MTTPEAAAEVVKVWLTDALVADQLAEAHDDAKSRDYATAPSEPAPRSMTPD